MDPCCELTTPTPRSSRCPPVLRGALGALLSCGPGWEEADRGCWGGTGDGVVPEQRGPCREKWCHMTQEERDDSLRFNENITFGQLG